MLKKFTAILLGVCIIAISGVVAAADSRINISQEGTQTVVISGNLGVENANKGVVVQVYTQGFDYSDLSSLPEGKTVLDVIKFNHEGMTNEKGEYEFKFDITTGSQWITPYIGTDKLWLGGSDFDYMFVNDAEWRNVAGKINDAANSASTDDDVEISTQITEKYLVLGFSESDIDSVDNEKLAKIVLNMTQKKNLDVDNRDDAWNVLKQALMVEQLNEKKISNIYDLKDSITQLSQSDIKDWYNKKYVTEKLEKNFTERLSGQSFENFDEYKAALETAFILATVNYPNGVDNVEEIVEAFDDEIGVSASKISDKVWSSVAGNDYETLAALKKALNGAGSNSGGGSGGGGGGTAGRPMTEGGELSRYEGPKADTSATPISKDLFTDLKSAEWAKDAIVYLAEKQIINGTGDNKFEPDANITREQFCKIVIGAFMPDAEKTDIPFTDVNKDEWYADYVAKAFGCGVITGIDEKTFGVGQPITRQDMCVMIYRAAAASGMEIKADEFTQFDDDAEIADYAKEAVYSLKEFGAVNGVTEGEFLPLGNATRAQAAKIIYYLVK